MKNRLQKIVLGLDIDINIQNINFVSVWCWLYVLSNTYTTLETEFMKELKNTEAGLIRSVHYFKYVNFIKNKFLWY